MCEGWGCDSKIQFHFKLSLIRKMNLPEVKKRGMKAYRLTGIEVSVEGVFFHNHVGVSRSCLRLEFAVEVCSVTTTLWSNLSYHHLAFVVESVLFQTRAVSKQSSLFFYLLLNCLLNLYTLI